MPQPTSTSTSTSSDFPAAPPTTETAPLPESGSPQSELADALEQLAQLRAQFLLVQQQNAEMMARETQRLESLTAVSDPRNLQPGAGLGIQIGSIELGTTSTGPQDPPQTDASAIAEQQLIAEATDGVSPATETSVPDLDSAQPVEEEPAEELQHQSEAAPSIDPPGHPPPPPIAQNESPISSPPTDASPELPEWADVEEDTSEPDEEELKEIEVSKDVSARDVKHHEDTFYVEAPEDPEQQPSQKMRLTWVIKGVRGTKEKPNRARIMNSPAVLVGGFYWYLKFFPRGNNSSALSAYVKCSRKEPKPDEEVPENTFSAVYGDPGADLGELKPAVDVSIPATIPSPKENSKAKEENLTDDDASKKNPEGETLQHDESANASADTEGVTAATQGAEEDMDDWRVSAQIGIIIYNPEEPRTKFDMAACHQFNKHNDDWGWTNFHGPWSEIHKRRRGQRQALLRNDTLALDGYVRIFNDPSQALWWHHCSAEEQWDSLSITGYPAMGTKMYHSPSVAGITSWLLLAPFRKMIQSLDTDGYRRDSHIRPQSLCSQLQMILYLMRKQKKDEKFVSLDAIVEIIDKIDEAGTDVVTFWEGFRRSLELELSREPKAIEQLSDIFDGRPGSGATPTRASPLRIPVENVSSVQAGLDQTLGQLSSKQCFPKFLTVELERQKFDTNIREWKLSYDRVRLSEELDLSQWSAEPEIAKYTLYGFVVHVEERNSGKFYSILRPDGPGSKWLAFEDGTPNQVISYTRHRIQDFEGLEGEALRENKATRQTAYLAMYIRTDLVEDFLPGALEACDLSPWLRDCPQVRDYLENKDIEAYEGETRSDVKLEIYTFPRVVDRRGLVDIQDLTHVEAFDGKAGPQLLSVPAKTTYLELRQKLAKWNGIDNVRKIKLWTMHPSSPGAPLNMSFKRVSKFYKTFWDLDCATRSVCVWMHVLETDEEANSFGDREPVVDSDVFDRTILEERMVEADAPEVSEPTAAAVAADPEAARGVDVEVIEGAGSNALHHEDSAPVDHREVSEVVGTSNIADAAFQAIPEPQEVEHPASELAHTNQAPMESGAADPSPGSPDTNPETLAVATGTESPTDSPAEQISEADTPAVGLDPMANSNEVPSGEPVGPAQSIAASAEDESLIAALIAQDLEFLESTTSEADPQVHMAVADVTSEIAPVPSGGSPDGIVAAEASPVEVPEPEQSSTESVEIGGVPPPVSVEIANEDAQSDSSEEEEAVIIRRVSFFYGFIQLFDAHAQDFIMRSDFLAPVTSKVKDFVKKRLGYADDKNFLIWRRGIAYRMSSVPDGATFQDIKDDSGCRHDGLVLVVGDVLSDST